MMRYETTLNERPPARRRSLAEMTGVKPAETNQELWTSRDPHGSMHKLKQHRTISNEPADQRKLDHKSMAAGALNTHVCHKSADGPRRRTLPKAPTGRGDHSKLHTGKGKGTSVKLAGDAAVPAQTPLSHSNSVHQPPADIQRALDEDGGPAPATHQPIYQLEGEEPLWPDDIHKWKRGADGKWELAEGPIPIDERPPWQSLVGEANSLPGCDIQPVLGRTDRHLQNESMFGDRHLIQSLRIEEDPNSSWRMDKIRRKTMAEGPRDDGDLPDVFVRLLDHKRYTGAHKSRFSADGQGMGLQGRREDDELNVAIAGKAVITRNDEPEIDFRHKPIMPWEERKRSVDAHYACNSLKKERARRHTSADNESDDFKRSVLGRLSKDFSSLSSKVADKSADAANKTADYEECVRKRKSFSIDKTLVRKWQN